MVAPYDITLYRSHEKCVVQPDIMVICDLGKLTMMATTRAFLTW